MSQPPRINDLVRDGLATPSDGALLFQLRRDVAERRAHKQRVGGVSQFFMVICALFLAFFARRTS
jgi:hypothetical protein